MRTRFRASTAFLLVAACIFACQDDSSGTPGTTTTMTSGPSSSPSGSDSAGSTTDGPNTSFGSGTETGGSNPHEICQRYLACIAEVSPGGLPEAQMGFGENGSCWQGSDAEAQLCIDACRSALEMYNELFPEEMTCAQCHADSECDTTAGEVCFLGNCAVTSCGDGVVDPTEMCDSQPSCDEDCQGPQQCNPLSNYPCPEFEVCYLDDQQPDLLDAHCSQEFSAAGLGQSCGFDVSRRCVDRMGCVPKDFDPTCIALGDDGCCQPLCDLGVPESCEMGRTCIAYQDYFGAFPPELGFLGVCVLS
ncbi:hypothetical protein [Nannocystis bainbridge]|uniref:Uncharacterized protein n=1 Tax=Nannocystis bainbridge TaxID=2995303 RepID=A0ABT5DUX4_9BACT|nr:hypothetical protein [Nannocystis bainbridge]MDC0716945.1 hypothetical protein [Nannocystis bainbridge]